MALVHLTGYVGYVLKNKHNKCYGQISRSAPHITNSEWTFELSKGGLFIPNESLLNTVKCCENFFSRLSDSELINRSNIIEKLCSRIIAETVNFDRHVVMIFYKTRIKIRIKKMNTKEDKIKSVKRVRILCRK